MHRETGLLGAKLMEKGVQPRNVRLQMALAEFQNNGGTYGVALAMLNAAYGKGSEGRSMLAGNGQVHHADASPTNDGEAGRVGDADKATVGAPASPSTATGRGEGQLISADKVMPRVSSVASRPGHAKRGAIAIASVQAAMAKSLFDTTVLPDGRKLRDVRWSECPTLATRYRRVSRILMAVHNHAVPPDPDATLDTVINDEELSTIVASVERFNEIH